MKLTKKQREQVYAMFGGHCAYCGHELPATGWHADHVEPITRKLKYRFDEAKGYGEMVAAGGCYQPENDRSDNFFPSCRACNIHKSNMSLEGWREYLSQQTRMCRTNHAPFRHAERFGLVQIIDKPIVFWFETYGLELKGETTNAE